MPPDFVQQVTFLYTDQPARSFRFYEAVLGLPVVLDQGPARIYRVAGEAHLGVCETSSVQQGPPPDRQPGGVIVTFVCRGRAEVDDWHRTLTERGVVFEKAPAENASYRIYNAFFRDPDGYLLEIQAFLEPAWPLPE